VTKFEKLCHKYGVDPDQVPVVEKLHVQILEAIEDGGRLSMGAWHACETAHCRAGWTTFLAGPAGRTLERTLGQNGVSGGTCEAAYLITLKSCPYLELKLDANKEPEIFFDDHDNALDDIERWASIEMGDTL